MGMGIRGGIWVVYGRRKIPFPAKYLPKNLYSWLGKLLKHNKNASQISSCTVRCQIKVHKVNFKAKNNGYFQHL